MLASHGDGSQPSWFLEEPQPVIVATGRPKPTVRIPATPPPASPASSVGRKTAEKGTPSWLTEEAPLKSNDPEVSLDSDTSSWTPWCWRTSSVDDRDASPNDSGGGCCCPGDPVLYWCRILHFFAGVSVLFVIIANAMVLLFDASDLTWKSVVLHGYCLWFSSYLFSYLLGIPFCVARISIFESWIHRGIGFTFLGVLTYDDTAGAVVRNLSAACVMSLGVIYIILGVFGGQRVESNHERYHRILEAADAASVHRRHPIPRE